MTKHPRAQVCMKLSLWFGRKTRI